VGEVLVVATAVCTLDDQIRDVDYLSFGLG